MAASPSGPGWIFAPNYVNVAAGRLSLDQQVGIALKQLHGFVASLRDSRTRYEATGDVRYLDSIKAVLPFYATALRNFEALAAQAHEDDLPGPFLLTLDEFSGWASGQIGAGVGGITKTLQAAPTLIPLLAIAAVLGFYFYSKRK